MNIQAMSKHQLGEKFGSCSKAAENCASRDKPEPLQMTKSCYPGQVTPLQQPRHVLVWLLSEPNCNIQIAYYKN